RVGSGEAAQRVGARRDHGEAALHVVTPVVWLRRHIEQRFQAAGNRLDRRQRVVQLVADDANQSTPGQSLLFAQWLTEIGKREELVRRAALPELGAADLPSPGAAREAQILNGRRV